MQGIDAVAVRHPWTRAVDPAVPGLLRARMVAFMHLVHTHVEPVHPMHERDEPGPRARRAQPAAGVARDPSVAAARRPSQPSRSVRIPASDWLIGMISRLLTFTCGGSVAIHRIVRATSSGRSAPAPP
jgi:hypothetical protein